MPGALLLWLPSSPDPGIPSPEQLQPSCAAHPVSGAERHCPLPMLLLHLALSRSVPATLHPQLYSYTPRYPLHACSPEHSSSAAAASLCPSRLVLNAASYPFARPRPPSAPLRLPLFAL